MNGCVLCLCVTFIPKSPIPFHSDRRHFVETTTRDAWPQLNRVLKFFPANNSQPKTLSADQVTHFDEKGYVGPLDVFSPAEIAEHRAYFDRLLAAAQDAGMGQYAINGWHRHCRGLYDLVMDSRIHDYVQDILGENFLCWGTHYFCKTPGDPHRVAWHQDASYWPLTPSRTVTVWLAIDDVDVENGAMKVIPRSHLHGQIDFDDSSPDEKNVLGQTVNDAETYGDAPVPQCMRAGQISLHSDLLLHGSEPNPSQRRRCGLTMRFCPPTVTPIPQWGKNAVLCRGSLDSEHGLWEQVPRPELDGIPDFVIERHQKLQAEQTAKA